MKMPMKLLWMNMYGKKHSNAVNTNAVRQAQEEVISSLVLHIAPTAEQSSIIAQIATLKLDWITLSAQHRKSMVLKLVELIISERHHLKRWCFGI